MKLVLSDLLGGVPVAEVPIECRANLAVLIVRVNQMIRIWGKPAIVTSGYRTMRDHLRIYQEKAAKAKIPFDPKTVPKGSRHLTGEAVDIYDPGLRLTTWLKDNPDVLEDARLWAEAGNRNWVHLQTRPPGSGNRWFIAERERAPEAAETMLA